MRLTKSLLCGISALALATGAAFAGDGSQWQSVGPETDETLSLEQYAEPMKDREALGYDERDWMSESDRLSLSQPDVIYEETIAFSEPMNDRDALAYIGESSSMSESDRLALSEPDLVLIYEETIVFVPSVDTEMSLG